MENFNFCAVIPPLRPCHLSLLPPFSPCHLTTFMHLSHLTSSLLSYLSQLTTLRTTNRSLQNSNILPLVRQGKHVWLIVGQLFMKPGRWDAPLALLDLAEAIIITRSKISYSLIEPSTTSLYTSLRLRIPFGKQPAVTKFVFSPQISAYRKSYNSQHVLIRLIKE